MLTFYDWAYGIAQISAVILSIAAGIIAVSMFRVSKFPEFRAWRILIPVLVLFAVEEVLGALRTFGIWSTPHLTHVVPSIMLALLIVSLLKQISIMRGCE